MALLLLLPLLLAVSRSPLDIALVPGAGETFAATLTGPAAGARAGPFEGTLSLNGSAQSVPIAGRAEVTKGRLRIPLTVRYADVPADWANRYRPEGFDYRVRGRVAEEEPVEWTGTQKWDEVEVGGDPATASRFLKLETLEVTEFSFSGSTGRAVLAVRNPFSFPVKLASARYRIFADGREVGRGETRGMLLRAAQKNTLLLPVELDHGSLVAAAGRAVVSGGGVAARLSGTLTVRLPGGDVPVPLDLSGRLSL